MDKIRKELKRVCKEPVGLRTRFIFSLEKLKVQLIDYPLNPYKSLVDIALNTWAFKSHKWTDLSPKTRFYVTKEVLERRALPLGLEAPKFTFAIENVSRAHFDQIARARIGVVYGAKGFKDDYLNQLGFVIPSRLRENKDLVEELKEHILRTKDLYLRIQHAGYPNYAARCVIPMFSCYNYMMSINFLALQNLCNNRMNFTEEPEMVGVAWLLRERIREKFPLLANYLRPGVDWRKKYKIVDGFADILGVAHKPDGRWPVDLKEFKKKYKIRHPSPCTDIDILEKTLKIHIPRPNEWENLTWKNLSKKDKKLFEED